MGQFCGFRKIMRWLLVAEEVSRFLCHVPALMEVRGKFQGGEMVLKEGHSYFKRL